MSGSLIANIVLLSLSGIRAYGQAQLGNEQSKQLAQELDAWLRHKAAHPSSTITAQEVMEWVTKVDEATESLADAIEDFAASAGLDADLADSPTTRPGFLPVSGQAVPVDVPVLPGSPAPSSSDPALVTSSGSPQNGDPTDQGNS